MESAIHSLRVETYKAQLAVCNQVCMALLKELQSSNLAEDRRIAISRRCDAALKESQAFQEVLDLMELHDRETRVAGPSRFASSLPTPPSP